MLDMYLGFLRVRSRGMVKVCGTKGKGIRRRNTLQPYNVVQYRGFYKRRENLRVGYFEEEDSPPTVSKLEHEEFGRVGFGEYLRGVIACIAFSQCC